MNFLALIIGLAMERLLTHLFHLREFRWLDRFFDDVLARIASLSLYPAIAAVLGATLLPVLPVALASAFLVDEFLHIPYFLFSVVVLFFSLGPRDLQEEVDDYCSAVAAADDENALRLATEIAEGPPADGADQGEAVARAVYIHANNRVFAVVLWFFVLGPTGAWLFRVLDLLRRRMAFRQARQEHDDTLPSALAVYRLHGVMAWLPGRLLAAGYALAGSFDGAIAGWRRAADTALAQFYQNTEMVLAEVGRSASAAAPDEEAAELPPRAVPARAAMGMVTRVLWLIWCPILAILTLYHWIS